MGVCGFKKKKKLTKKEVFKSPRHFMGEVRRAQQGTGPAGEECGGGQSPPHPRAAHPEAESTRSRALCKETVCCSHRSKSRANKKEFRFHEINFKSTDSMLSPATREKMGPELTSSLCRSSFYHK